jgi:Flp pilus assembly protein TadG
MMHKRGQELVEFALVLPLLLLIVLGGLAVATDVAASTQVNQAAARAALDGANSNANTVGCKAALAAAQSAVKEVVTSGLVTVTKITVDCDAGNSASHEVCTGTLSSDNDPRCNAFFTPGNILTVKVETQINVAVLGAGPNLVFSSTGAAIIPRSP